MLTNWKKGIALAVFKRVWQIKNVQRKVAIRIYKLNIIIKKAF
jgi:hypothetical protein